MLRVVEDVVDRPLLDDAPEVHDHDLVGHLGDHAEVVGDEHDRHVVLVLEIAHQVEDLRLGRHVERRGRLVGDQQRGSQASAIAIIARWRRPPESW